MGKKKKKNRPGKKGAHGLDLAADIARDLRQTDDLAALDLEAAHKGTFVFGYEEALGYAVNDYVRDKDGVTAAVLFAELADRLAATGRTVGDRLDELKGLIEGKYLDLVAALVDESYDLPWSVAELTEAASYGLAWQQAELVADQRADVGLGDVQVGVQRRIVVAAHPQVARSRRRPSRWRPDRRRAAGRRRSPG